MLCRTPAGNDRSAYSALGRIPGPCSARPGMSPKPQLAMAELDPAIYDLDFWDPRGLAPLGRGYPISKHCLLKLNLGAHLFELRLDLGSVILIDAFLDVLRRAFDQVFGLFEAKPGNGADLLDDLDLFLAGTGQNDRKFSLFFRRRRAWGTRCGRPCGDRHGGGSRDAPLLFE